MSLVTRIYANTHVRCGAMHGGMHIPSYVCRNMWLLLLDNNLKTECKQKKKVLKDTHVSQYFNKKIFLTLEVGIGGVAKMKREKKSGLFCGCGKLF